MKKKIRKLVRPGFEGKGRFLLPGVGDGLVDPEFDDVRGGEREAIEGVVGHGRAEDTD